MDKKYHSRLVKIDGDIDQEQDDMTIDQVMAGLRKIIENEGMENLYIFRRYPLRHDGETLNTHIHIRPVE